MKTRLGFVSNSSSSSFILIFPHKPTSALDVQEILFEGREFLSSPYNFTDTLDFPDLPVKKAAEMIWEQIVKEPNGSSVFEALQVSDAGELIVPSKEESLENLWKVFYPYFGLTRSSGERNSSHYYFAKDIVSHWFTEQFINENLKESARMYILDFNDNSSATAIMEHPSTYSAIPHLRVSFR